MPTSKTAPMDVPDSTILGKKKLPGKSGKPVGKKKWRSINRPAVPLEEETCPLILGTGYNAYADETSGSCPLDVDKVHSKKVVTGDTLSESSVTLVESAETYMKALDVSASLTVSFAHIFSGTAAARFHAATAGTSKKLSCVVHATCVTEAVSIPQDQLKECVTEEFKRATKNILKHAKSWMPFSTHKAHKMLKDLKARFGTHVVIRTKLGSDLRITFTSEFSERDTKLRVQYKSGASGTVEGFTAGFKEAMDCESDKGNNSAKMELQTLSRGYKNPPPSSSVPKGENAAEKAEDAMKMIKDSTNDFCDRSKLENKQGVVVKAYIVDIDVLLVDVYEALSALPMTPFPVVSEYEKLMLHYMKLQCVKVDGEQLSNSVAPALTFLMPGLDDHLPEGSALSTEIQNRIYVEWERCKSTFVEKLDDCIQRTRGMLNDLTTYKTDGSHKRVSESDQNELKGLIKGLTGDATLEHGKGKGLKYTGFAVHEHDEPHPIWYGRVMYDGHESMSTPVTGVDDQQEKQGTPSALVPDDGHCYQGIVDERGRPVTYGQMQLRTSASVPLVLCDMLLTEHSLPENPSQPPELSIEYRNHVYVTVNAASQHVSGMEYLRKYADSIKNDSQPELRHGMLFYLVSATDTNHVLAPKKEFCEVDNSTGEFVTMIDYRSKHSDSSSAPPECELECLWLFTAQEGQNWGYIESARKRNEINGVIDNYFCGGTYSPVIIREDRCTQRDSFNRWIPTKVDSGSAYVFTNLPYSTWKAHSLKHNGLSARVTAPVYKVQGSEPDIPPEFKWKVIPVTLWKQ